MLHSFSSVFTLPFHPSSSACMVFWLLSHTSSPLCAVQPKLSILKKLIWDFSRCRHRIINNDFKEFISSWTFDMSCVWWNFDLKDLYVFYPLSWTPIINITQKILRLLRDLPNNEQFQYVHQFAAFLKHNVKGKCAISYLKQKKRSFFFYSADIPSYFYG